MKKKHLSVDMMNLEKHYDTVNIDSLRYFRRINILSNIITSAVVIGVWLYTGFWSTYNSIPLDRIVYLAVFGAFFWLFGLTGLAYAANNPVKESFRLASRRCLFSFTAMNLVIVAGLLSSPHLTMQDLFSRTLVLWLYANVLTGYTSVFIDLGMPVVVNRVKMLFKK